MSSSSSSSSSVGPVGFSGSGRGGGGRGRGGGGRGVGGVDNAVAGRGRPKKNQQGPDGQPFKAPSSFSGDLAYKFVYNWCFNENTGVITKTGRIPSHFAINALQMFDLKAYVRAKLGEDYVKYLKKELIEKCYQEKYRKEHMSKYDLEEESRAKKAKRLQGAKDREEVRKRKEREEREQRVQKRRIALEGLQRKILIESYTKHLTNVLQGISPATVHTKASTKQIRDSLYDPAFIKSVIGVSTDEEARAEYHRIRSNETGEVARENDDDDLALPDFAIGSIKHALQQGLLYPEECYDAVKKLRQEGTLLSGTIKASLADWLDSLKTDLSTEKESLRPESSNDGGTTFSTRRGSRGGSTNPRKRCRAPPEEIKGSLPVVNEAVRKRRKTMVRNFSEQIAFLSYRARQSQNVDQTIGLKRKKQIVSLTPQEASQVLQLNQQQRQVRSRVGTSDSEEHLISIGQCDAALKKKFKEINLILKRRRELQRNQENLVDVDPAEGLLLTTDPLLHERDRVFALGPNAEFLAPYVLGMMGASAHDPMKQSDQSAEKAAAGVFVGKEAVNKEGAAEQQGEAEEAQAEEHETIV
jgi:hypothetical protein